MRDGIKRALDGAPGITVVGEAMTGADLIALVPQVCPDVVVLDIRMPKGDGFTSLRALHVSHPDLKVVMLSTFDDSEHVEMAFGYGASAYAVKSINPRDLASTIRGAFEGTVVRDRRRSGRHPAPGAVNRVAVADLTVREVMVLKLVAEGMPNLGIADDLFVTEQTVKFHLSNIYRKLGVSNRTAAAHVAHESALID
jgi:DNA-binding NarL/FixJ family response regulator